MAQVSPPARLGALFGAACGLLLSPTISAQLGVQVRALTDLEATAYATPNLVTQTIPAGTDLTNGYTFGAFAPAGPMSSVSGGASSAATVQRSADSFTFEVVESASGSLNLFGPLGSFGSFGIHQIELVFDHPSARAMELVVERCIGPGLTNSYASASLGLPNGQVLMGTPQSNAVFCQISPFSEVDVVPITIDQRGFRVVLTTRGGATGSIRTGNAIAVSSWRITVRPDPTRPCTAISYGQGCGPAFEIVEEPALGPHSYRATLDDPALPSAAWLVGGGVRTVLPLPPSCDLLNDALVIVPWPIDAQGHAELILAATPGQVFSLQLQAATFAGGLRLSNGFEFACR